MLLQPRSLLLLTKFTVQPTAQWTKSLGIRQVLAEQSMVVIPHLQILQIGISFDSTIKVFIFNFLISLKNEIED